MFLRVYNITAVGEQGPLSTQTLRTLLQAKVLHIFTNLQIIIQI
jgi:hypothetical protein